MIFRERKRSVPSLNTTSTADISFMLLIFFLLTTSLGGEKGIARQLPPPEEPGKTEPIKVDDADLLCIEIGNDDVIKCDGEPVTLRQLKKNIMRLAASRPETHVLSVMVTRETSYEAYFQMQNAIVEAYRTLRAKGVKVAMRVAESEPESTIDLEEEGGAK